MRLSEKAMLAVVLNQTWYKSVFHFGVSLGQVQAAQGGGQNTGMS